MKLIRLLILAAPWALLILLGVRTTGDAASLFHGPALILVVGVPFLVAALAHRPGNVGRALVDAFAGEAADLPSERRAQSVAVLRTLGGTALAMGIVAVLLGMIAILNALATAGGQTPTTQLAMGVGGLMIAPLYGVAVRVFLWDPLANALEGSGEALAAELAADVG